MDTRWAFIALISIAIGGMIWQMGGFASEFAGEDPGGDLASPAEINESARKGPVSGDFSGDARASDGSLVGLIISGGSTLKSMAVAVVYLPGELIALGLPRYAARPLGTLATLMTSIGLILLIIGRVWR